MHQKKTEEEALAFNHLLSEEDFFISLSEPKLPVEELMTRNDRTLICVCTNGKAEMAVNMIPLTLLKHRILVLFPNQIVSQTATDKDFSLLYLRFSSQFMNEVLFHFPPNFVSFIRDNYTHQLDEKEFHFFLSHSFQPLKERFDNKEHLCRREIMTNLLRNYFLDVYDRVQHNESLQSSVKSRKNELMERFCTLVMSDFKINREVIYYAGKLFVTPKYLSKVVKEQDVNHRSAKEFIDDYTITEIKMMLKYSSPTLQEIAGNLNFPNPSFLCKYFKSRTGLTPKEFKRQIK
jgi:AraC family transcriptional regulator, transcriptional activator of pobA